MGVRQSVVQPPRTRAVTVTPHSTHSNGFALHNSAGPSTSFGPLFGRGPDDGRVRSHSVGAILGNQFFSTESDSSSEDLTVTVRNRHATRQLSAVNVRYVDVKCPVCYQNVASDQVEIHLVMCLTRPRVAYNDDVLTEDKGECVICFDDLLVGQIIARLPCLCIYHKNCIDEWFKRKNCCPEHPD